MKNFVIVITLLCIVLPVFGQNTEVEDSLDAAWEMYLDEAAVVVHKPAAKFSTDKVEYSVKDDPMSKTQSVLELLRKVPMVTVDAKNNISVNGSQEFLVYINGRPSSMITRNPSKILRGMPAGSVQKVEVITNPGAKYDAEGVGGVLNIITKKKRWDHEKELSGSCNTILGTNHWGEDVSLSYQGNRWTVDASIEGEYEYQAHAPNLSSVDYLKPQVYSEKSYQDSRQHMPFTMGMIEVGYVVDSLSAIHLSLGGNYMVMKEKGATTYTYNGGYYESGLSLLSDNDATFNMGSVNSSLDYQRFFGVEQKGSLMFTYQNGFSPGYNKNYQIFQDEKLAAKYGFESRLSKNHPKNINHNLLADFVVPVSEWLKINTGSKYTADSNKSEAFKQQQNILASYAETEISYRWLEAKAGLRHEYTWQHSIYKEHAEKDFNLHYGILAPSGSLTATLNSANSLGFNYNLRIRRPDIEELDPYVEHYSPSSVSYGNPHLDVEKTNAFSLIYMLHLPKLSLNATLMETMNNNGIQRYSFLQEGLVHSTFGNVVKHRQTSFNLYASWSMTKSTRVLVNSELHYNNYESKDLDAKNNGWCYGLNMSVQQELPWRLKFSTNLEWMTKDYNLQGWESGMAMLTASIARSFCHDRWTFSLSGTSGLGHGGDLLWTEHSVTRDFISENTFTMPAQSLSFSITYNFGGSRKEELEDLNLLDMGVKRKVRRH